MAGTASLKARLDRLELESSGTDYTLKGALDIVRGEMPIDALRRAPEPGMWLLVDYNDTGHLGQMSRAGVATMLMEQPTC